MRAVVSSSSGERALGDGEVSRDGRGEEDVRRRGVDVDAGQGVQSAVGAERVAVAGMRMVVSET